MTHSITAILVALSLVACGGEPFGADFTELEQAGAGGEVAMGVGAGGDGGDGGDTGDAGAGYAGTHSDGGSPLVGGSGGSASGGAPPEGGAPQGGSAGAPIGGTGGAPQGGSAGAPGGSGGSAGSTTTMCSAPYWQPKTHQGGEIVSSVCDDSINGADSCPVGELHRFRCLDKFLCGNSQPGHKPGWAVAWEDLGICDS